MDVAAAMVMMCQGGVGILPGRCVQGIGRIRRGIVIMTMIFMSVIFGSVGVTDARELQGMRHAVLRLADASALHRDHQGHGKADADKTKQAVHGSDSLRREPYADPAPRHNARHAASPTSSLDSADGDAQRIL